MRGTWGPRHPTVGDVPSHRAATPGRGPSLVGPGGARSWPEIADRAQRILASLLGRDVGPGGRVATLLPNCVEYVELIYGIALAGCAIVPLNSKYVAREIGFALDFCDADLVVVSEELASQAEACLRPFRERGRVWVVGQDTAIGDPYEDVLSAAPTDRARVDVNEDDVFWMPFTSGTTGSPKQAVVTHRSLIDMWNVVLREFDITRSDTVLVPGPFYHSMGFIFGLAALFAGATLVIHRDFDARRVLADMQTTATVVPMVPTMYTMVLAALDETTGARGTDLSGVRALVSAGSPLLTSTKARLLEAFPRAGLYEFYGSTEIGTTTVLRPEDQLRKTRCVGLPVFGSRVRIVDESGLPVQVGAEGEIEKSGTLLGSRYHNNDDATAAMYNGEWVRTGDIGRMDAEGYLYVVDRKKDMIVTGGANVFPSEVEEVIARHPGVEEVAVVGVPDDTWGEVVKAFIVVKPGCSVEQSEVAERCRDSLANFKRPRIVEFCAALPKSGAGKVLKRELRDRHWLADGPKV